MTTLQYIFYKCGKWYVTNHGDTIDFTGWDTSKVQDLGYTFGRTCNTCGGRSLDPDVTGWDTSSVTNLGGMLYNPARRKPLKNHNNKTALLSNLVQPVLSFEYKSINIDLKNCGRIRLTRVLYIYILFRICRYI